MLKTLLLGASILAVAGSAQAATATRSDFGTAGGAKVEAVTLTNNAGTSARIMTLGATLQSLLVADKAGKKEDVVLGYDTAQQYLDRPNYFGASIGRYANRIAKGKFSAGRQEAYTLAVNNPGDHPVNALHGGLQGF